MKDLNRTNYSTGKRPIKVLQFGEGKHVAGLAPVRFQRRDLIWRQESALHEAGAGGMIEGQRMVPESMIYA